MVTSRSTSVSRPTNVAASTRFEHLRVSLRVQVQGAGPMFEKSSAGSLASIGLRTKEDVLTTNNNLAARVGRWSIRHRKAAIIGWFVFVLVAFFIGGGMGMKQKDPADQGVGESG